MADDYYQLLGVSKTASPEEIQKAYRKQARKFHPDLHADKDEKDRKKAKQQFQKIQQAYATLNDPEKRKMYDQFGSQYEQMGGGGNPFGGGGNPMGGGQFDFSQIFGGAGGGGAGGGGFEDIFRQMGGGRGQGRGPAPTKGNDIEQEITVPFAVAVLGGKHQVGFQRGDGKTERIDVTIPAGIESGKKIRLRGQGHAGTAGPGDLMITVDVAPHPNYARKGSNLIVDVPITILEATEGAKIDVPTPHGTVAVKVPAGTSSGKTLRLKGMGIKGKNRTGDLLATLQIVVPDNISDHDRELLNQLSDSWASSEAREQLRW